MSAELVIPQSPSSNGSTDKVCYTDPTADATLVSTPEGRQFKVESFYLKANSYFLRRLLQSPDYHGEPIKIPASTKVLKVYLDIVHNRYLPPGAIWSIREPLLKLCDEMGSPGIAERALFVTHHAMEKDPWEVFRIASQRGNAGLAKSALRAMADKPSFEVPDVAKLTPDLAKGVAIPYLLGLYNAALAAEHINNGISGINGYSGEEKATWKIIAEKFTPVKG